jgi:hypothetical protein
LVARLLRAGAALRALEAFDDLLAVPAFFVLFFVALAGFATLATRFVFDAGFGGLTVLTGLPVLAANDPVPRLRIRACASNTRFGALAAARDKSP